MKKILNVLMSFILILSLFPPLVLSKETTVSGISSDKVLVKDPNGYFLIVKLSDSERQKLLNSINQTINAIEWLDKTPKVNVGNYMVNIPIRDKSGNVTPYPIDLSHIQVINPEHLPKYINGRASVMFLNFGPIGFCLNSKNKTLCTNGFNKINENLTGDSDVAKSLVKSGFSQVMGDRIFLAQSTTGGESSVFYLREHMYDFVRGITSTPNMLLDGLYAGINAVSISKDVVVAGGSAIKKAVTSEGGIFKRLINIPGDFKKKLQEFALVKRDLRNVLREGTLKPVIDTLDNYVKKGKFKDALKYVDELVEYYDKYGNDMKVTSVEVDIDKIEEFKIKYSKFLTDAGLSHEFLKEFFIDPIKNFKENKITTEKFLEKYTKFEKDADYILKKVLKKNQFDEPKRETAINALKELKELGLNGILKVKEDVPITQTHDFKVLKEMAKTYKTCEGGDCKKNAETALKALKEIQEGLQNVKGVQIFENGKLVSLGKGVFGEDTYVIFSRSLDGWQKDAKTLTTEKEAKFSVLGIKKGRESEDGAVFSFVKENKLASLDEITLDSEKLKGYFKNALKEVDNTLKNLRSEFNKINDIKKKLEKCKKEIEEIKKDILEKIDRLNINGFEIEVNGKSVEVTPDKIKEALRESVESNKPYEEEVFSLIIKKLEIDKIKQEELSKFIEIKNKINDILKKLQVSKLEDKLKELDNIKKDEDEIINEIKETLENSKLVYNGKNVNSLADVGKYNDIEVKFSVFNEKDVNEINSLEKAEEKLKALENVEKVLEEAYETLKNKNNFKIVYGKVNPGTEKQLVEGMEKNELVHISRYLLGNDIAKALKEKWLEWDKAFSKFAKEHKWLSALSGHAARMFLFNLKTATMISSFMLLSNDLFGDYAGSLKVYGFAIDMKKTGNISDSTEFVAITPPYYLKNLGYEGGDAFKAFVEFITGEKLDKQGLIEKATNTIFWFFSPSIEPTSEKAKEEYIQAYKDIAPVLNENFNLMVVHDGVSPTADNSGTKAVNVVKKDSYDIAYFEYNNTWNYGVFGYISKHPVQVTVFDPPWVVSRLGIDSMGIFTRNVIPLILYQNAGIITNIESYEETLKEQSKQKLAESYLNSYMGYVVKANDELYRQLPKMIAISTVLGGVAGIIGKTEEYSHLTLESRLTSAGAKAFLIYLMLPIMYDSGKAIARDSIIFNEQKFLKESGGYDAADKYCEDVLKEGNAISLFGYNISWYTLYKVGKNLLGLCTTAGLDTAVASGGLSLLVSVVCGAGEYAFSIKEEEQLKKMFVSMAVCKERNHIFIITRNVEKSELGSVFEKINSTESWIKSQINSVTNNNKQKVNESRVISSVEDLDRALNSNSFEETLNNIKRSLSYFLRTTSVTVDGNNSETYFYKQIYLVYLFNATAYKNIENAILRMDKYNGLTVKDNEIKDSNGKTIAKINPGINYFDLKVSAFAIPNKVVLINKNKEKVMFKIDSNGNLNITYNNLANYVKRDILLGVNKNYHVSHIITDHYVIDYYNGKLVAVKIISNPLNNSNVTLGEHFNVDEIDVYSNGKVYIKYNGNLLTDDLKQVFLDNDDGVIDNEVFTNYLVFAPRDIIDFNVKQITDVGTTGEERNNKPIINVDTKNETLNNILDNLTKEGVDAVATNDTLVRFNKDGSVDIVNTTSGIIQKYKKIAVTKEGIIVEKDGKFYLLKIYKDPKTGLINVALVPLNANNEESAKKEAQELSTTDIKNRAIFDQPMMYLWTPNGMMYQNPKTGDIKVMNDFAFPINPNFNLYGAMMNGDGMYPSPNPLGLTPGNDFSKEIKKRPALNIPSIPEGVPGILFVIVLILTIMLIREGNRCNVQNAEEKQ